MFKNITQTQDRPTPKELHVFTHFQIYGESSSNPKYRYWNSLGQNITT